MKKKRKKKMRPKSVVIAGLRKDLRRLLWSEKNHAPKQGYDLGIRTGKIDVIRGVLADMVRGYTQEMDTPRLCAAHDCNCWFYPTRGRRHIYHTATCQNRLRMRRWRANVKARQAEADQTEVSVTKGSKL